MFRVIALAALTATALSVSFGASAETANPNPTTVVLVHGAFADGSSWQKVIPLLQARGLRVVAVQNPLTSLADDVATTQRAIRNAPGKVVLVGHSWGGTVITQAGGEDKVSSLVYVAAFAPDIGQSSAELGAPYPTPPGLTKIVSDSDGFLSLPEAAFKTDFAQDLSMRMGELLFSTQGPILGSAFNEKVTQAAWRYKPSWYVIAGKDRMIQPELQRALANRIGAHQTVLKSSHAAMLSNPYWVANVILDAAGIPQPVYDDVYEGG